MPKYEVFFIETSDGHKRDGFRTRSQAEKFLLPKLLDNGSRKRDPRDLNEFVVGSVASQFREFDTEEAARRNYRQVKGNERELAPQVLYPKKAGDGVWVLASLEPKVSPVADPSNP